MKVEESAQSNPRISHTASLAVIVLTRNEERNLPACLRSVSGWAKEVFVVDSGSDDSTLDIARQYDAITVFHQFESHARQWKWALENLPISTDWILGIDADQQVTPQLREEISTLLEDELLSGGQINGCYVRRRQIFRGKWIKHGGYYPKHLLKLFRLDAVWLDEGDRVDHHFRVRGKVIKLKGDIIEDNQNESDISVWIEKHNRYARLQALEEFEKAQSRGGETIKPSFWGTPDERVLWLKELWSRMPLYVRPFIYFLYRYVFLLGFLDGKEGFVFHFLQAFWYRLLIDIKLDELRQQSGPFVRQPSTPPECEQLSNKV